MRQSQLPAAGRTRRRLATIGAGVLAVALVPTLAFGAHGLATLPGSNFEIDDNANLWNDEGEPWVDWADLAHPDGPEVRATDKATGQNDDSYKGGVKEDTTCPGETTGSIPNNKSDLLTFHTYEEPGVAGHPGFFNMAWSRVSDPSGTTLMDFEFNQSNVDCSTGPNKVRTQGDLLIEYAIDQGGARADLSVRTWSGSAWGNPVDLDVPSARCPDGDAGNDADIDGDGVVDDLGPCAVGTINNGADPIPASESDGLGEKQPRTFGEAQIDLRFIFEADKCRSFGSAMVKSRSSDAFTSQLKDFISPVGISLTNCGKVIIRKQTDPDENPNSTDFKFEKSFGTDPATSNAFTLQDDGVATFNNVLFGNGYTVKELLGDDMPAGWDFVDVKCGDSENVTPSINDEVVTFSIDSADDVLDCTYTNRARGTIIIEKVTSDGSGAFDFTSNSLTPASWTLTTTGAGAANKDSRTFSDLAPGTYDAAETVPAGWNLTSATCDDGSAPSSIGLSGGETVTCTFTNARERGAILITKTRKHAASGPGDHPHNGVTFTVKGGELPAAGTSGVTAGQGTLCVDNLVVSSLVGTYDVSETVPAGYKVVGDNPQTGIAVTESTCGSGAAEVDFENIPLTDITVSVDSQVDGGTASTMVCTDVDGNVYNGSTGANGDGSLTVNDLLPTDQTTEPPTVTLTCAVYVDP